VQLARQAEAEVVGCSFLIELAVLGGRARLDARCHSVLRF
jgi:adenine/guanine phosphoribosyltransferase-like PRPP-binding protein